MCFHRYWDPDPAALGQAAAAAAKSLQLCPTLCDPIDGGPPGSAVPGILQARTLEWVAISFSNAWKWKVKGKSLSRVRLLATPWTTAHQTSPSMGFSRQEYWSRVPLPSPLGQATLVLSTLSAKTTLLTPSAPGLGTTVEPLFISENVTDKILAEFYAVVRCHVLWSLMWSCGNHNTLFPSSPSHLLWDSVSWTPVSPISQWEGNFVVIERLLESRLTWISQFAEACIIVFCERADPQRLNNFLKSLALISARDRICI